MAASGPFFLVRLQAGAEAAEPRGLHLLKEQLPKRTSIDPNTAIKEMKALLIKAMALTNISESRFANAEEWFQVKKLEADTLLRRLGRH